MAVCSFVAGLGERGSGQTDALSSPLQCALARVLAEHRDGDTVLAESGAIVDYIVHRHGAGRLALRPEAPDYARYLYWLHFAEGSLMSLMLIALVLSRIPEANESPVRSRVLERLGTMLEDTPPSGPSEAPDGARKSSPKAPRI